MSASGVAQHGAAAQAPLERCKSTHVAHFQLLSKLFDRKQPHNPSINRDNTLNFCKLLYGRYKRVPETPCTPAAAISRSPVLAGLRPRGSGRRRLHYWCKRVGGAVMLLVRLSQWRLFLGFLWGCLGRYSMHMQWDGHASHRDRGDIKGAGVGTAQGFAHQGLP